MENLRTRSDLRKEPGMDPKGEGRSAITRIEETSVWDFLRLVQARGESRFTKCPHLTLSIQRTRVFACVTVPNGIRADYRRKLLGRGFEDFATLCKGVCRRLENALRKADGAAPWVQMVQRDTKCQVQLPN